MNKNLKNLLLKIAKYNLMSKYLQPSTNLIAHKLNVGSMNISRNEIYIIMRQKREMVNLIIKALSMSRTGQT